ncbi:MAG: methyl-accepting chemotaxis protein [Acetatifactor sp.]|nr:methyl-accepting chemotaxis protein [Acetatifactor sp.]
MEEQKKENTKSLALTMVMFSLALVLLATVGLGATGILVLNQSMKESSSGYEGAMDAGYRTEIKSQIQAAIAIVQGYYDMSVSGEMTEAQAKEAAKEVIRGMRYRDDGSGYMWIDDTDYNLVMHPILPEQEGNNRYELKDPDGVMIIQSIMKSAQAGGGYNQFSFTKADGVTVAPKVAYSEMFEPWGWVITTGNYVDDMQMTIEAQEAVISANFRHMIIFYIIIAVVIVVIGIIGSWIFGQSLVNGIKQVDADLRRAAEGDLTFTVDAKLLHRADEVGNIARSTNAVKNSLTKMITSVIESSSMLQSCSENFGKKFEDINITIGNINKAVDELTYAATEQASETEVVNNKVIELGNVIDQEKTDAVSLDASVESMMNYSKEAIDSIDGLYNITEKTTGAIDVVYQQTIKNNESADHINKAVTIIKDMAEQTNLLSLNASIEAARAGEAGRGFAVVAEEIMKLADQSANSAEEIERIATELIQNVGSSVSEMNEVNQGVEEQKEKLEFTKNAFQHLYQEIQSVSNAAKEIGEQTVVLDTLKSTVGEAMTSLASVVEQNAASMQETNASMQMLSESIASCNQDTQTLVDLSNRQSQDTKQFKL